MLQIYNLVALNFLDFIVPKSSGSEKNWLSYTFLNICNVAFKGLFSIFLNKEATKSHDFFTFLSRKWSALFIEISIFRHIFPSNHMIPQHFQKENNFCWISIFRHIFAPPDKIRYDKILIRLSRLDICGCASSVATELAQPQPKL